MSTVKQSPAAIIQRLRRLWCVRINGLNTTNYLSLEEEHGMIPSPDEIPGHWRGRWGTDGDYTFICLITGDLFILHGEPNTELINLIGGNLGFCPNGSGLRVPYCQGESLQLEEIIARIRDPYLVYERIPN